MSQTDRQSKEQAKNPVFQKNGKIKMAAIIRKQIISSQIGIVRITSPKSK